MPALNYHNAKYKAIAEQLSLTVERHPVIGWSLTTLPHATAAAYANTISEHEHAITLHRRSEPAPGAPSAPASSQRPL